MTIPTAEDLEAEAERSRRHLEECARRRRHLPETLRHKLELVDELAALERAKAVIGSMKG